jgi:ATP-dependent exoDNAse (exonuclease V) beta subunit
MSQLTIYKASAGSGKTYTLAWEFILLLFKEPNNYRSILAVTFTNKATAEMKSRILEYLHALAFSENPEFMPELCQQLKLKEAAVQQQARWILSRILNDFSHFNISTIDSFFQKIIRSFAFEAGLPANLKIELDTDKVLKQAIDVLLRELDIQGKEQLKEWVLQQTLSKLEEGNDWKIVNELYSLGKEIFKEEFQKLSPEMLAKINDKKQLKTYIQQLSKITSSFEKDITTLCRKGLELLNQHQITWSVLNKKSRSPLTVFDKLKEFNQVTDVHRLRQLESVIDNPEELTRKDNTSSENDRIISCFNDGLNELMKSLLELYRLGKEDYFTARVIVKNTSSLGIISDIALTIRRLAREQNLFLLADANLLLNKIIDENDAPFIYEKAGSRYQHYMIDEFQDTSGLQWLNFKPLIENSLSQSNTALIVGDVKQSIYRWRNSNWKLLSHQVQDSFKQPGFNEIRLQTNWRSFENIIHFNNIFFNHSARLLQNEFIQAAKDINPDLELPPIFASQITDAYNDVLQQVSNNGLNKGGYLNMQFLPVANKNEYHDLALPLLLQHIDKLLEAGYQHRDICILVRRKEEGKTITEYLLGGNNQGVEKRYPIISNEALLLGSSPVINYLVQQLRFIQSPHDDVTNNYLQLYSHLLKEESTFSQEHISPDWLGQDASETAKKELQKLNELNGLALYEQADYLASQLPDWVQQEQASYIRGFLDIVKEFIQSQSVNLSDFMEWWDDKGCLSSISIPEDQNAIQVMTIHKSKGLEFKAVLLPFCHWPLDDRGHQSLIWCNPQSAPFNALSLVPVYYNSQLIHSQFCPDYLNEKMLQFVDNLNLLYVAFTRARESLVILGQIGKTKSISKVSDLLLKSVQSLPKTKDDLPADSKQCICQEKHWNADELIFTYGEIPHHVQIPASKSHRSLPHFKTIPIGDRLKFYPESEVIGSTRLSAYQIHGNVMHQLFERIVSLDDLEPAIDTLIMDGKLSITERPQLVEQLRSLLSQEPFKHWFDGSYKVLNETSILQSQSISRPDRVMISPKKVIVVDYKFGLVKNKNHHFQVQRYMSLLKKMGYQHIEGYLWYLHDESLLERVEDKGAQLQLFD